jgi:uncharacterized membrane protein YedE/YeeE
VIQIKDRPTALRYPDGTLIARRRPLDLASLVDFLGEDYSILLAGLLVGVVFGIAAQRSRFCLRAASVEFARGALGPKLAVWLLTFATAVFWTQAGSESGLLSLSDARILASPGSVSGAVLGGLLFGVGMVLDRGCSSRLLVLAASGNLRALISGLVFAVVAQMSFHGWLAPLREYLAGLWVTPGGANIQILDALGLPSGAGVVLGLAFAAVALWIAWRNRVGFGVLFMASGVGFAVALGWWITHALGQVSFEPVGVESITFTGPSADTLMFFLTADAKLDFDVGLVPGAFLGAFLAAAWARELKLQGFEGGASMRRYLIGAALMGFGGMLAGGCAVGAGVTGGSAFALTAWITLTAMWAGAAITDALVDRRAEAAAVA